LQAGNFGKQEQPHAIDVPEKRVEHEVKFARLLRRIVIAVAKNRKKKENILAKLQK
jgi:hypothetical protein